MALRKLLALLPCALLVSSVLLCNQESASAVTTQEKDAVGELQAHVPDENDQLRPLYDQLDENEKNAYCECMKRIQEIMEETQGKISALEQEYPELVDKIRSHFGGGIVSLTFSAHFGLEDMQNQENTQQG